MAAEKPICVVVGAGQMGIVQAKAWNALGYDIILIDPKQPTPVLMQEVGSHWWIGAHGRGYDPDAVQRVRSAREKPEVWNISCPTDMHFAYAKAALDVGARKIFLEKPATESVTQTKEVLQKAQEAGALIQVDYVERAQRVLKAAMGWIKDRHFYPTYMFFRRSHDMRERVKAGAPEDLKWITFRDLCHDVSELELILRHTWWHATAMPRELQVVQACMTPWQEKYGDEFPFSADVSSEFVVRDPWHRFTARIKGDNDDELHRYFVLSDGWRATWVSTAPRPKQGIFPAAGAVYGMDKVKKLIELAESERGLPNTLDELDALNTELGRKRLCFDPNPSPIDKMIRNLHEAQKEEDLICSLSTALWIEEVIHRVYEKAGVKFVL